MSKTTTITRTVFLISITLIIEMIGLPQPVTGPLVNMMLILTTLILNPLAGIILGAITPTVALIRGQLPSILFPMVPFIIVGNASLVLIFALVLKPVKNKNTLVLVKSITHWLAIIAASTAKFVWLYLSVRTFLPLLLGRSLPNKIMALMALPQLITALLGGIFALIVYQLFMSRYSTLASEAKVQIKS